MKLNRLLTENAPSDIAELFLLTSKMDRPWDPDENPGDLKHKDPCPKCGSPVTYRRVGLGAPKFLGCQNDHAYVLPDVSPRVAEPDLRDVEALPPHSCRFPPSGPEDEGRIRKGAKSGCEACSLLYDRALDDNFAERLTDDIIDADDEDDDGFAALLADLGITKEQLAAMSGREKAATLRTMILSADKRGHHQRGEFGTGRSEKMHPDDSLAVLYLKMKQQEGMKGGRVGKHGSREGKKRIMDRDRHRDRCTFGHTCGYYPNGEPAANYPLPDPVATSYKSPDITGQGRYAGKEFIQREGLMPGRFNEWFTYTGKSHRWPVSGISGYQPKLEFQDVVGRKYSCEVCLTRELGEAKARQILGDKFRGVTPCNNPVAQELGKLKPFCSEHADQGGYPQELLSRFGGPGLPGQPDPEEDYRERKKELEGLLPGLIEVGDEVKGTVGKARQWGVGTVMQVDPSRKRGDTHFVDWNDGPEGWVKPQYLELPGGRNPRLF